MNTLFDDVAFISLSVNPHADKRCKTCKYIVRHYYDGRWIYTSCSLRHVGRRNYRVKATQQACQAHEEDTQ